LTTIAGRIKHTALNGEDMMATDYSIDTAADVNSGYGDGLASGEMTKGCGVLFV
jgi:hypothetical protein